MDKRGKNKASALTPGAAAMLAHIPVPDDIDGPEADAIVQVRFMVQECFAFVHQLQLCSRALQRTGRGASLPTAYTPEHEIVFCSMGLILSCTCIQSTEV